MLKTLIRFRDKLYPKEHIEQHFDQAIADYLNKSGVEHDSNAAALRESRAWTGIEKMLTGMIDSFKADIIKFAGDPSKSAEIAAKKAHIAGFISILNYLNYAPQRLKRASDTVNSIKKRKEAALHPVNEVLPENQ